MREAVIESGAERLHATWWPADGRAIARAVIVHGYGDHSGRYVDLRTSLAAAGIGTLAFDLRGHGRSSGRRSHVSRWEVYLDDLAAVLDRGPGDAGGPLFVIGHSHGGLVAAFAAQRRRLPTDVRGVVLANPFLAPAFRIPLWKRSVARIANVVAPAMQIPSGLRGTRMCTDPVLQAETAADPLLFRVATPRWYAGCLAAQREAFERAREFTAPLLVLVGTGDTVARPASTREWFARTGAADKRLIEYPGLLHELFRETDRNRVFADVAGWIGERC